MEPAFDVELVPIFGEELRTQGGNLGNCGDEQSSINQYSDESKHGDGDCFCKHDSQFPIATRKNVG